jgi:circadian clock protein KaiC
MSEQGKVDIRKLPTGVTGLDEILGGGLSEFSFNVIAGSPGTGKTTLAHQILFANATTERPGLYFTVLGEPTMKMLRYQQQYTFFDPAKLNSAVRFINLGQSVSEKGLNDILDEIRKQVEAARPGMVVVDSFRSVIRRAQTTEVEMEISVFVQQLAQFLTSWQATTFLLGEYVEDEIRDNPIFTVADGLLWLSQRTERNSVVRKLRVVKLRGQASIPGLHTMRISNSGVETFPRSLGLTEKRKKKPSDVRISIGNAELDAMLGGGIPQGDSLLVAGSSGTGKSIIGAQFIADGLRKGESCILAVFEERPKEYADRARNFGLDLETPQQTGKLKMLYLRPLDLTVEEAMQEVLNSVREMNARRLVLDSLSGFEVALAPGDREDFREALYRMISALTGTGVTILSTIELTETFYEFLFSAFAISFLTDDIIRLRYVELEGKFQKILTIIKTRGSSHSNDIRQYQITTKGLVIDRHPLEGYHGLTSGIAEPLEVPRRKETQTLRPTGTE